MAAHNDRKNDAAVCFLSSGAPDADAALNAFVARYGNRPIDDCNVIVALGGDGLMLQTLHRVMENPKPQYVHCTRSRTWACIFPSTISVRVIRRCRN